MSVESAFDTYQTTVNANPDHVTEARRRRDLFKTAFAGEADVEEVRVSGSLARGTQKHPIHDVDTVIVFKASSHPDWGQPGGSAEDALNHVKPACGSCSAPMGPTRRARCGARPGATTL